MMAMAETTAWRWEHGVEEEATSVAEIYHTNS